VLFADDDDPIARAIAAQVIHTAGYGVVVAENGSQALEMARRYRPELVITDAMMPGLDGREVARTIKAEMATTKLVIITSVYKDARYKHEALRDFGADEYVKKPVACTQCFGRTASPQLGRSCAGDGTSTMIPMPRARVPGEDAVRFGAIVTRLRMERETLADPSSAA
jgi:CheY-like chemotaxis protein